MFAVYILQCSDNSYYVGLSNDIEKRMWQHDTGYYTDCYTFKRRPVSLVWQTRVKTSKEANQLEKQIKGWSRKKKEALISGDIEELKRISDKKKKDSPMTLRQAQGQVEFLIIGQGLSGTWLSYYLKKKNKSFLVIDNNNPETPSRIAAGIINPVTGRRIVKTWMIDELIPFVQKAYTEFGNDLGVNLISEKKIIDFFPTLQIRQAFLERRMEDQTYLHEVKDSGDFNNFFNYEFGYGVISPVFITHIETQLPLWRKQLLHDNCLYEDEFDVSQLNTESGKIRYKEVITEKIIYCDGVAGFNNPVFKRLPFAFNKGEVLLIEVKDLPVTHIFKKGLMLSPFREEGLFWVGTNYLWKYQNDQPTKEFRERTELFLKSWLKIPFKIIDHKAAIRPATVERRPFVGLHPNYKNLGLLNGMGTKGCSLAPFFASQLAEHLIHKKEILPEADILRFSKTLSK